MVADLNGVETSFSNLNMQETPNNKQAPMDIAAQNELVPTQPDSEIPMELDTPQAECESIKAHPSQVSMSSFALGIGELPEITPDNASAKWWTVLGLDLSLVDLKTLPNL